MTEPVHICTRKECPNYHRPKLSKKGIAVVVINLLILVFGSFYLGFRIASL